jgi:uncharacterized protein YjbI with pentapeptide repeats
MSTIHASTAAANELERRRRRPSNLLPTPVLPPLWRPIIIDLDCKTRILLVTDGLSFNPGSGFGLGEAAGIIASATTTNHDVEVTTAHWSADPTADVENFRFAGNHTVNGVSRTIHYYEEIWIFGLGGATAATAMGGSDLDQLETFMDDGGGVFCTGDHDDLGAFLSGNVKRVKSMRPLARANLAGADLSGANLVGASLAETDLTGARLEGATLVEADLRGANLRAAALARADLTGADLTGVDLRAADLAEANLQGADLAGPGPYRADLFEVEVGGLDLPTTALRGADLRAANLRGAKLMGLNLESTNLAGANLCGANLKGAILSKTFRPDHVHYDCETVWPWSPPWA